MAPSSEGGFLSGLSTAFNTGVSNKLRKGAIIQDVTALHVSVGPATASISTQIATLRRLLLGNGKGDLASQFSEVVKVCTPVTLIMNSLMNFTGKLASRRGCPKRGCHGLTYSA